MPNSISRREFMGLMGTGLTAAALLQDIKGQEERVLRGGTARVNITPKIGSWLSGWEIRTKPSEGVADNLYAKALCLSNSTTEIAIVSTDLIGVTASLVADIRERVSQSTGIPYDNLLISASHTHFGPVIKEYKFEKRRDPAYIDSLKEKLAGVVKEAHKNMVEVSIGAAKGQAPELLFNRRMRRKDGKVVMIFVLPPAEPDLSLGPVDPEVGVIRVEDSRGKLVAALINFACHPVSGGGHGEGWESWFYHISADYPAYAAEAVEKTEGGNCLFTLGTAGDMVPIKRGIRPRFEIGRVLGGEALKKLQFMEMKNKPVLAAVRKAVRLPLKTEVQENANEELAAGAKEIETEIQGLKIGDIVLVGLPGEVLVELGLVIKKKAGVQNLFLISLSNDTIGYICHEAAYDEGGYEPERGTNLARGAGEILVAEVLRVIEQLKW